MQLRRSVFTLLFVLSLVCPALAQQEAATITGEVRDASGALVPKAQITITNVETNVSLKSETNDQGLYTVPGIKPGPYSITVERSGFKKFVRSGVTLQVNQTARIDINLQVGEMTSVVEITGDA
ncbi:MAG: carboxypeptidase-like regulatory domain-containing protein, partial [Blastocatellia bacterium]